MHLMEQCASTILTMAVLPIFKTLSLRSTTRASPTITYSSTIGIVVCNTHILIELIMVGYALYWEPREVKIFLNKLLGIYMCKSLILVSSRDTPSTCPAMPSLVPDISRQLSSTMTLLSFRETTNGLISQRFRRCVSCLRM
jgi:hypothetical protein